ncbi:hypothetical protein [Paenibacillus agilis]|uniref:Uncharacterized protein n=1 Tax=Paenibacillus agilis TaxID=3020863 RepID=A0A559IPH1_9BACL|nr:hypothetical protein [Paenibacillus agilis]TVX89544.1 hypothetical protein FPZ44_17345 [Paenibacillus agilis]
MRFKMLFKKELITALISSLLACPLLAWMHDINQGTNYHSLDLNYSYSSLVFIYFIFATPFFLLTGVPTSIALTSMIQKLTYSSFIKYAIGSLCFFLSGVVVYWAYIAAALVISRNGVTFNNVLFYMLAFSFSALFYFHVGLVVKRFVRSS